jgi:hypothetical protein
MTAFLNQNNSKESIFASLSWKNPSDQFEPNFKENSSARKVHFSAPQGVSVG